MFEKNVVESDINVVCKINKQLARVGSENLPLYARLLLSLEVNQPLSKNGNPCNWNRAGEVRVISASGNQYSTVYVLSEYCVIKHYQFMHLLPTNVEQLMKTTGRIYISLLMP